MQNPTFDPYRKVDTTDFTEADRLRLLHPDLLKRPLDSTAIVFRRSGFPLIAACAVPSAILYFMILVTFEVLIPGLFVTSNPQSLAAQAIESAVVCLVSMVIVLPTIAICFGQICRVAVRAVWKIADPARVDLQREEGSPGELIQLVLRVGGLVIGPALLITGLMVMSAAMVMSGNKALEIFSGGLIITLLAVAAVWGFIYLATACLAPPAMWVEKLSPKEAIQRSKRLMKFSGSQTGSYNGVLALGLFGVFIGWLIVGLGGMGMDILNGGGYIKGWLGQSAPAQLGALLVDRLPIFFAVLLVAPMIGVGTAILYLGLRIRLEAYDVELLRRETNTRAA